MWKQLTTITLVFSLFTITISEDCGKVPWDSISAEACQQATVTGYFGEDICCYYEYQETINGEVQTTKMCESVFKGKGLERHIEEYKRKSPTDKNYKFITYDCSANFLSLMIWFVVLLMF